MVKKNAHPFNPAAPSFLIFQCLSSIQSGERYSHIQSEEQYGTPAHGRETVTQLGRSGQLGSAGVLEPAGDREAWEFPMEYDSPQLVIGGLREEV